MATQRLPVPGADDDQWGTILNGFLRVLHAEDGSIQQWENDSERPTSPDEGETGINLKSGLFEAYQNGQWVTLTKDTNCVCPLMVVERVFPDLVNVDITLYTMVLAKGYWSPSDWGGGIFVWKADATEAPDGGRYFKSSHSTTGRWVRKFQDNVNVLHYGAVPDRKFLVGLGGTPLFGGVYGGYGYPSTGYFTSKPLSSKFSSLTQARDWYGAAVVSSLGNEIDYCAIQATIENNLEVFIPEGAYRCNEPLKMIRKRKLYGAGEQSFIYFNDCAALVPRQTTGAGSLNYVYQDNFYIGFLHFKGSYKGDGKGFDDGLSAINFPANLTGELNQAAPTASLCKIEHLTIEYFAGHGVKLLDEFNCALDFVSVQNCGGHGIYMWGGNTCTLRDCWPGHCGEGYASYRILSHATLIGCNGNDTPKNWWGVFGGVGSETERVGSPNIHLLGCNIEGAEKCIQLLSTGYLLIENCLFQAKLTKAEPYFIFDEAYQSQITLINNKAFSTGEQPTITRDPITGKCTMSGSLQYAAFIKSTGLPVAGRYLCIGRSPDCEHDWLHRAANFDASGNPVYGDIVMNIPTIYAQMPYPGLHAIAAKDMMATQFFVGTLFDTARILSGHGSPLGAVDAPVGSLYLRRDGGTGTTLYIKESGTGNTGWVPVT